MAACQGAASARRVRARLVAVAARQGNGAVAVGEQVRHEVVGARLRVHQHLELRFRKEPLVDDDGGGCAGQVDLPCPGRLWPGEDDLGGLLPLEQFVEPRALSLGDAAPNSEIDAQVEGCLLEGGVQAVRLRRSGSRKHEDATVGAPGAVVSEARHVLDLLEDGQDATSRLGRNVLPALVEDVRHRGGRDAGETGDLSHGRALGACHAFASHWSRCP
jgi:hypothetical protein